MEKYAILLGYFDKQWTVIKKLQQLITEVDLTSYDARSTFALKTQQFYTAIEDLLKQIAKNFENHVQDLSIFHKELLIRLHTEVPSIRPQLLSDESFVLLDKMRSFRHFIRHAYDCELIEGELRIIQDKLKSGYEDLEKDFLEFRKFIHSLA